MVRPIVQERVEALRQKAKDADALIAAARAKTATAVTTTKSRTPTPAAAFGLPTARRGENIMSSRPFSFLRLMGNMSGKGINKVVSDENCKVEHEISDRLHKAYVSRPGGFSPYAESLLLAPLGTELMGSIGEADNPIPESFRAEMKALTIFGKTDIDQDEVRYIADHVGGRYQMEYGKKATPYSSPQSWLDETIGGALVAPPEFGELIQLLRNKDALINAGCRVVPMPPSGRLRMPRQTSPTIGYFIGENQAITPSQFLTGTLLLSNKKCCAIVTMPNELIRFASPAAEALLRADMTKTLALTFDYYALQGQGSDNVPQGVINTPGIAVVSPTTAASGNTLALLSPQDLYKWISAVEANNAEFQGWILRPEMFWLLAQARASTYNGTTTAQVGPFVYDQFRQLGMGFPKVLSGYPAVTTPQVSQSRVQGSNTAGTFIAGGQWDDAIMALFGTIEFAQAPGEIAFQQDQVMVRAIMNGDFGLRHPGAFAWADVINMATLGL
jgi:HK97 family phage major capsid protein